MSRIVVVDDDEGIRKTVRFVLEQLGHEVKEACNGVEAISMVAKDAPDLVITDIVMPEKEGLETIQEMKRMYPLLKIIAMSGGGPINRNQVLRMAQHLGAACSLAKPFSRLELEIALEEMLSAGDAKNSVQ